MKPTEYRWVERRVTRIAVGAAILFALLLPSIHLVAAYNAKLAEMDSHGEILSNVVSRHIYLNPEMWDFEQRRLEEKLDTMRHGVFAGSRQRIVNSDGETVVVRGEPPKSPTVSIGKPLSDGTREVGRLEYIFSLRPMILDAAIMAFLGALLGIIMFVVVRGMPLRALAAATENLRSAHTDIEKLNHSLEERVALRTQELRVRTEELRVSRDEAEAASSAKSQFLANMSHEIRTPMNGVLGIANLLLRSGITADQESQVLIIKESGNALLTILNDILDLSKIEAGKMEIESLDFPLKELLDAVEAIWGARIREKGLTLSIETGADVAPVLRSDPGRIRQNLFNLLGNAVKFTESGGVTVRISQRALAGGELEIRFAVSDTGIGIAPEDQARLFSNFSQADNSMSRKYGGTGLGLAICKQLAELMGGETGLDSAPGEGSTFWFTVRCPAGDGANAASDLWSRETEQSPTPEPNRPLRILVAEDNRVNRAIILAILGRAGHQVEVVNNGAEAVAAVLRSSYDLILMDVQMPEMNGVAATAKIRGLEGETGRVPIIGITANAMKGDREKYHEAGMDDYVSKPIDDQELNHAIARQCGGSAGAPAISEQAGAPSPKTRGEKAGPLP